MFRESLLDSSPNHRHQKRWPMATAFALEFVAAGLIIIIPLISTGVIPVSARVPRDMPLQMVRVASKPAEGPTARRGSAHPLQTITVTPVSENRNQIHYGDSRNSVADATPNPNYFPASSGPGSDLGWCAECQPVVQPPVQKPFPVSHLSEAQLIHRVEPVYPRMAVLTGIQGEVKLHAIIAKDGSIQSLSVSSGHPMLAQAALDAVRQWRYRPYILNGQPVEVETFITVNFRKSQ
ncbi:MAG TPA: energy transducer TonB [Candidatus Angelobacter sp.]|nr:energy transducer TonB [Candidatus Angelobacter sp.]